MKRLLLMLLMLCAGLLTGCAALPAEERAFAVALAISGHEGAWTMHARIPTYQAGGGYATITATGDTPERALSALDAAAPMPLHTGQLRLLILSADTARTDLPAVMAFVMAQESMRAGAAVAVTQEDPAALMEALKPATGSRLSKALDTLLETRIAQGTILPATLADVMRMGERQQAALVNIALDGEDVTLSGCWPLSADGLVTTPLAPEDTQLLALMQGSFTRGSLALGDGVIRLTEASARAELATPDLRSATVTVTVGIRPAALTEEAIRQSLATACLGLCSRLSAMGCDALGLGRQAATYAGSLEEWRALDWPQRYRELDWAVTVGVTGAAQ